MSAATTAEHESRISTLRARLAFVYELMTEQEAKVTEAEARANQAEGLARHAQQTLADIQAAANVQLSVQEETSRQELSAIQHELGMAQLQRDQCRSLLDKRMPDPPRTELLELQSMLSTKNQEIIELRLRIDRSKADAQIDEAIEGRRQHLGLDSSLESGRAARAVRQMERDLEHHKRIQADAGLLQQEIDLLTDRNRRLEKYVTDLTSSADRYEQCHAELSSWTQVLSICFPEQSSSTSTARGPDVLRRSIDALVMKLSQAESQISRVSLENNDLSKENQLLEEQISRMRCEVTQAKTREVAQQRLNAMAQGVERRLTSEIRGLREILSAYELDFSSNDDSLRLKTRLKVAEKVVDDVKGENSQLRFDMAELIASRELNANLSRQLHEANSQIERLQRPR